MNLCAHLCSHSEQIGYMSGIVSLRTTLRAKLPLTPTTPRESHHSMQSIQLGRLSVHSPAWRSAVRLHVDRRKATVVSVGVQRP
jgi:hypothetical protein